MQQLPRYVIRIARRRPASERYGWAICRQHDSVEVKRSTKTFETCTEALLDSVQVAQSLVFPLEIPDLPSPKKGGHGNAVDQRAILQKRCD